jgi:transcriptional regulator with XRE-family HTH domain
MDVVGRLGKRLKMIRIAAGVKQKDLSASLGIPAPLLSMYETGAREPGLPFLEKFAKHFGLPLSQIFVELDTTGPSEGGSEIVRLITDMRSLVLNIEKQVLRAKA